MKLRWTTLLNTVIGFALVLYGVEVYHYVHLTPTHQAKWDALYQDTRGAYDAAAGSKDANASQFDDKFHEARNELDQLDKFQNDLNNRRWIDSKSSEAASTNMKDCLTALQVYHLHKDFKLGAKLRIVDIVNHCVANGNTGTAFDSK